MNNNIRKDREVCMGWGKRGRRVERADRATHTRAGWRQCMHVLHRHVKGSRLVSAGVVVLWAFRSADRLHVDRPAE
jgi:hypothetical protein